MKYGFFLEFLFPPRCVSCKKEGVRLCSTCAATLSRAPLAVGVDTWSISPYHHPVAERLVHAMKYGGKKELAVVIGEILSHAIPQIFGNITDDVVLVPIPSSANEVKHRGYDHVALMTQSLSRYIDFPFVPALIKIRETERQVKMQSRERRIENLKHAFQYSLSHSLEGKVVILIDDVTTTGATFTEARRALANSGATRVVCLALAH